MIAWSAGILDRCHVCGSGWTRITKDGAYRCDSCEHETETVTSRIAKSGNPIRLRNFGPFSVGPLDPPRESTSEPRTPCR